LGQVEPALLEFFSNVIGRNEVRSSVPDDYPNSISESKSAETLGAIRQAMHLPKVSDNAAHPLYLFPCIFALNIQLGQFRLKRHKVGQETNVLQAIFSLFIQLRFVRVVLNLLLIHTRRIVYMSVDTVKRQIEEAKKTLARAKEQVASLERTIEETERRYPSQSDDRKLARQHSA
jgi:hypothetical protein